MNLSITPGKNNVGAYINDINLKSLDQSQAKEIKKISTTHIVFVDLLGVKHEIKVVNPVGYDLRKIY